MKAVGSNVVIKPVKEENNSIIIFDEKTNMSRGKIVSIGKHSSQVSVGDEVLFSRHNCHEEHGLIVVSQTNILYIFP